MIKHLALAAFIAPLCQGQTIAETTAYIMRELPQAQSELSRTVYDGFSVLADGRLVLTSHSYDPVAKKTRKWVYPINDIDVSVDEGRFGTSLTARARKGCPPLCVWVDDQPPIPLPFNRIVGESPDPQKVYKLERAFKHLIELVSGRKELF